MHGNGHRYRDQRPIHAERDGRLHLQRLGQLQRQSLHAVRVGEASAGCSVSYTPTAGASGSQTITASYSGDATHTGSAHQADLQVGVAPGAPTITGLANGDARVAVSFTDANPGSSPITSYEVTATNLTQPTVPRVTAKGPESPITVTGLTMATHVFTVTATNADGTSPPSAPSERLN